MLKWIKFSERKPEKYQTIVILKSFKGSYLYTVGKYYDYGSKSTEIEIAWAPFNIFEDIDIYDDDPHWKYVKEET